MAIGDEGTILTFPDGVSWTIHTSGTTKWLSGANWRGSQFVSVGSGSDNLTSSMGSESELVHIYAAYWVGDEILPHWIPDVFIPKNGFVVYIEDMKILKIG